MFLYLFWLQGVAVVHRSTESAVDDAVDNAAGGVVATTGHEVARRTLP